MAKRIAAIILIILTLIPLTSCERTFCYTSDAFGTYSELTISLSTDFKKEFESLLSKLERLLSASVEGSDVDKFNKLSYGQTAEINKLTYDVLLIAKELYRITDGYYDPTVYPLVDLWAFTPRFYNKDGDMQKTAYDREQNADGSYPLPSGEYVAEFKKLVDFESVEIYAENGKYYIKKAIYPVVINGVTYEGKLDLGGLAKGYACSLVAKLVEENGGANGHFSCGGSSITVFDKKYTLSIKDPRADIIGECIADFEVNGGNISSSGDYERFYEASGVRYCHIIDPKTGYPYSVEDGSLISATLVGDDPTFLDGLSTAILCMGEQRALELLKTLDVKYALVKADKSVLSTVEGLKITDENYKRK